MRPRWPDAPRRSPALCRRSRRVVRRSGRCWCAPRATRERVAGLERAAQEIARRHGGRGRALDEDAATLVWRARSEAWRPRGASVIRGTWTIPLGGLAAALTMLPQLLPAQRSRRAPDKRPCRRRDIARCLAAARRARPAGVRASGRALHRRAACRGGGAWAARGGRSLHRTRCGRGPGPILLRRGNVSSTASVPPPTPRASSARLSSEPQRTQRAPSRGRRLL